MIYRFAWNIFLGCVWLFLLSTIQYNGYDFDVDTDNFLEDYSDEGVYAILQEQLDNVDIPCGIEAPVTLLPESDLDSGKKNTFESNSLHDTQSDATNSHVTTSSQTSRSLESNYSRIHGLASNPYKPLASTNFESATKAASICNSFSMNQVIFHVLIGL